MSEEEGKDMGAEGRVDRCMRDSLNHPALPDRLLPIERSKYLFEADTYTTAANPNSKSGLRRGIRE